MVGENPPSPPLDFSGPSCLDSLHGAFGLVHAGEQFGSHIGAFFGRQRQGFAEKLLRTRGHTDILTAVRWPSKPLQPNRSQFAGVWCRFEWIGFVGSDTDEQGY